MNVKAVCPRCRAESEPRAKAGSCWAWWIKHRLEGCEFDGNGLAGSPTRPDPELVPCP